MYLLDSNIIKDNILLLNITKDMGEHQDISRASVELKDYVIKPGSITYPPVSRCVPLSYNISLIGVVWGVGGGVLRYQKGRCPKEFVPL